MCPGTQNTCTLQAIRNMASKLFIYILPSFAPPHLHMVYNVTVVLCYIFRLYCLYLYLFYRLEYEILLRSNKCRVYEWYIAKHDPTRRSHVPQLDVCYINCNCNYNLGVVQIQGTSGRYSLYWFSFERHRNDEISTTFWVIEMVVKIFASLNTAPLFSLIALHLI